MYITTTMCDGVLHCLLFLMFFWCPYMAINVNVQYNGGFLPDIVLLTQCYLHRGTCLNAMKRFCIEQWPKTGTPDHLVAIIGYPIFS